MIMLAGKVIVIIITTVTAISIAAVY